MLLASLLAGLLSSLGAAAQNEPSAAPPSSSQQSNAQTLSDQEREDFLNSMSRIPVPNKGCFKAEYPKKTWQKVECNTTPAYPNPLARGLRPTYVGHGTGNFAEVTGNISSATGSFDSVTG